MKLKRLGIDLAKDVFQLHGVDEQERVVLRKRLKRAQLLSFIAKLEPTLIAVEACGGAHHWGRQFEKLGHQAKLIAAQFVKPYVKSGKNDANDAEAICEAAGRPNMRFVALKSAEAQALQGLHRIRSRVVRMRTALVNETRGLLAEFGRVEAKLGVARLRAWIPELLEDESALPRLMRELLRELHEELLAADKRLAGLDAQVRREAQADERVRRIEQVSGIGVLGASALVASAGDARQFNKARQFAASLGMVPRQHSSGGKTVLGPISKRGDAYLRTLLIHGARAVVNASLRGQKSDRRSLWIRQLVARSNKNVATVALANKNARIVWAMLTRGEAYRPASSASKA